MGVSVAGRTPTSSIVLLVGRALGGGLWPGRRAEEGLRGPGRSPRDLPPGVAAHVDSGNARYRAGDYEEARRHYRTAVDLGLGEATAWFGVYMAERALGNESEADPPPCRRRGLSRDTGGSIGWVP